MRRVATAGTIVIFVGALFVVAQPASAGGPRSWSGTVTPSTGTYDGTSRPGHLAGYRPLHPDAYARAKQRAAAHAPAAKPGPKPPPPPSGPGWDGQYETDLTPPDPTGAMGPTEYIEFTNLRYGVYNRSGGLLTQGTLGNLSAHNNSDLSDPQILWDPATQRFYYTVLDVADDTFAFGFSKTSAPLNPTDWCQYGADMGYGTDYLPDYPKMGDSSDFILIGSNIFYFGLAYVGSDVDWIAKPPAGTSCPGSLISGGWGPISNADGSQLSTPVPAVQTDPSSTGWVMGAPDITTSGPSTYISAVPITNDGTGHAAIGATKTITVTDPNAGFDVPPNAPERGSSYVLDTLDGRLERAVAGRDPAFGNVNAVWTAHAVAGGAGTEERWYEVDPSAGTVLQQGKATSSSLYVWNGAISPDRAYDGTTGAFGSNMVMGFNTSSSTTYPAIQMVTKRGASAQSAFVVIKQATGPNVDYSCDNCRWGDYSGASPDPGAAQTGTVGTVWLSGEWNTPDNTRRNQSPNTDWRTWNWFASP